MTIGVTEERFGEITIADMQKGEPMDSLKPCPFCKSNARLVSAVRWVKPIGKKRKARGVYWYVGCSDPDCILYLSNNVLRARLMFATRNKAFIVRRWNRRAGEAE